MNEQVVEKDFEKNEKSVVKHAPVLYWPNFLAVEEANALFDEMALISAEKHTYLSTRLKRKTAVLTTESQRKIPPIWGDDVSVSAFPPLALATLNKLANILQKEFNVCLVNIYETNKDSIGWHSDNEEKGDTFCIASISLGAVRTFSIEQKKSFKDGEEEQRDRIDIALEHGSLLVMNFPCQERYLHAVLPEKEEKGRRINLTFRKFHYEVVEKEQK